MSIYNPSIPQAGDDLSDSQPQILGNFSKADTSFGIDHYRFSNLTANNGFHQKVTWVDQTASVPVSVGAQVVAYGLTIAGVTMPYYKRDGLATQFSLSPVKAYANFTGPLATIGSVTLSDSFNVTTVAATVTPGLLASTTFTVTLSNAMRSATNYGIYISFNNNSLLCTYTVISATQFSFLIRNSANTAYVGPVTFSVMES